MRHLICCGTNASVVRHSKHIWKASDISRPKLKFHVRLCVRQKIFGGSLSNLATTQVARNFPWKKFVSPSPSVRWWKWIKTRIPFWEMTEKHQENCLRLWYTIQKKTKNVGLLKWNPLVKEEKTSCDFAFEAIALLTQFSTILSTYFKGLEVWYPNWPIMVVSSTFHHLIKGEIVAVVISKLCKKDKFHKMS